MPDVQQRRLLTSSCCDQCSGRSERLVVFQVNVDTQCSDHAGSGESSSVPILSPTPSPVPTSSPITVTNYLTPPLAELSSLTVELMCIVIVDRPGGSLDQFTCDISWERNGVAIESTEPVLVSSCCCIVLVTVTCCCPDCSQWRIL